MGEESAKVVVAALVNDVRVASVEYTSGSAEVPAVVTNEWVV